MDATRPVSYDVSDYLAMARRHWWVVLGALTLGIGGASAATAVSAQVYQSATAVLVQPVGLDTNVVRGRTQGEINLDTEAQLVRSVAVAVEAAARLHSPTPPEKLISHLDLEVPANTSVLRIRFSAGTAADAQAGARAFAEAYLANRAATAKAAIDAQLVTLNTKIKDFRTQLAATNLDITRTPPTSSNLANLQSLRNTLVSQINTLADRANDLATITVAPGRIINDAGLPHRPVRPNHALYLGSGAVIGLLLGICLAFARDRLDRRVRHGIDVVRRAELTVLAELPSHSAPRFDDVYTAQGPGGRIFNRLRNEVLAALQPEDRVIMVAGTSGGVAGTLTAAHLAGALARAGNEVILVSARTPDIGADTPSLAHLLGVPTSPGLTDVLAGRANLARAIQRAPRTPRLRVITTGSAASAAGLLQSDGVRVLLDALSQRAEYIVVEAPSTSVSADAQSLAGLADAAILVVEAHRTRHVEVRDAAQQLRRVGARLLGAVVLPRLSSRAATTTAPVPSASATRPTTANLGPDDKPHIPDARASAAGALDAEPLDQATNRVPEPPQPTKRRQR